MTNTLPVTFGDTPRPVAGSKEALEQASRELQTEIDALIERLKLIKKISKEQ